MILKNFTVLYADDNIEMQTYMKDLLEDDVKEYMVEQTTRKLSNIIDEIRKINIDTIDTKELEDIVQISNPLYEGKKCLI